MVIADQATRDGWSTNIRRSPRYSKANLVEPDFWFRYFRFNILSGNVELKGLEFQIGLMDWNVNGIYNDDEDRLLIGNYGSERINADLNGNTYLIGDKTPFAVGTKGFEIKSMDPAGRSIRSNPIDFGNVKSKLKIGDSYPEFSMISIDGVEENINVSIEKGKYNYIEFWGIWCKGCITELPTIKAISEEYLDKLNVIGLHVGEISKEKMDSFVGKHKMTWTQKIATEEAVKTLKVTGYPYGILVDPEGKIEAFNIKIEEVEKIINGQH